jgi:ribosome recycling factor
MINDVKKTAEQKMQKALEVLKNNLGKVRTGRAHAGLLDQVMVEYYGNMVPISQVGNVGLADARTITVQVWEKPMLAKVEKAIRDSDLGLNPSNSGDMIRVPMPPLTEERRRDLIKVVKGEGEDAKVSVRNVRRDANEQLKKLLKDKEIQKLTDKYVAEVDKALQAKEADLMAI